MYSTTLSTEKEVLWTNEQDDLRSQLKVYSQCDFEEKEPFAGLRYIGGVDVSFFKNDETRACACIVVLAFPSLTPVYTDVEIVDLTQPYIPGFLAFREVPSLLRLWTNLKIKRPDLIPQVVLVDGNGVLHSRGFGLASHFGVLIDTPTIGVAKTLFCMDGLDKNNYKECLRVSGDACELVGDSGAVHGMAVCLGKSKNPVFVSIGHRLCLESALAVVVACSRFRIPEPVRIADLTSRDTIRSY